MADDIFKFNDATAKSLSHLTFGEDSAQQAISDRRLAKQVGVTPLEIPYFRDEFVQKSLNQDAARFGGLPGFMAFTSDPLYGPLVSREPKDWEQMNIFEKAMSVWEQGRDERHEADLMQSLVYGQQDIDRATSEGARQSAIAEQEKRLLAWQDAMKRKRAVAQPKALERLSKADTFSDVMSAFTEQPFDIAYYTAGKSMASQAELLAAQFVAGLTGFFSGGLGTVLAMGVAGAGSYEVDRRSALLEAMQSQGVDLGDADAVNAFLSNAPRLQQALDQASAHAGPVAAIDALSMGVAGKVAGAFTRLRGVAGAGRVMARAGSTSLPFARRAFTKTLAEAERKQGWWLTTLDDTLTGSIAGGALGGLGEYLGQKNAGQKISLGDIFLESIADFANMPADMVSARAGKVMGDWAEKRRVERSAKLAQASKVALSAMLNAQLHQSAPDAFAEFAKQVGEMSGDPNLYIRADVIRQSPELANTLATLSPAMAQAVEEARELGTTVAVPLQTYAGEIGQNKDLAEFVRQNASRTPDTMSPAEVEAWKANQKNQQFAQENQREIIQQIKASKEFSAELDEAVAPIEQALMRERSEQMTPDVVHTQVKTFKAVLGNLATLAGVSPKEFIKRHPMQVQRVVQGLAANSLTDEDLAQLAGAALNVEIAPNPQNRLLTDEWNALPEEAKYEITSKIGNEVIGEVRRIEGLDFSDLMFQIGGWEGEVNHSLCILIRDKPDEAVRIAGLMANLLNQEAIYVSSDRPGKGLVKGQALAIKLPEGFTTEQLKELYRNTLYPIKDKNGLRVFQGFSVNENELLSGLDSRIDSEEALQLAERAINALQDDRFILSRADIYSQLVFPTVVESQPKEGQSNGNQSLQGTTQGMGPTGHPDYDRYKERLELRLRDEIDAAKTRGSLRSGAESPRGNPEQGESAVQGSSERDRGGRAVQDSGSSDWLVPIGRSERIARDLQRRAQEDSRDYRHRVFRDLRSNLRNAIQNGKKPSEWGALTYLAEQPVGELPTDTVGESRFHTTRLPRLDVGRVRRGNVSLGNIRLLNIWRPGEIVSQVLAEVIRQDSKDFSKGINGTTHRVNKEGGAPTFNELEVTLESATIFKESIDQAKKLLPFGACVESKEISELLETNADGSPKFRLFLSEDCQSGFALKNGDDIVSVFSAPSEPSGEALMLCAVAAGGRRLDCFNTILPRFYSRHGFQVVASLPFNPDYAPEGWDYDLYERFENGMPSIAFMVFDGDRSESFDKNEVKNAPKTTPEDYGESFQRAGLEKYAEANAPMDKASDILARMAMGEEFEQNKGEARGSFNPATGILKLFKSADESTFMHESAHYFLHTLVSLTTEALDRGDMTDGERELIRTLDSFLTWQNVQGATPEARIRNFASMSIDQQRDAHEHFARGFEAYLRQGKAPTKGLRNAFKKFKTWLVRLYRTVAELDVELSPEVSALYDRLFITEAEASFIESDTNMRPLFTDADKDLVGEDQLAEIREDFERAGADVRATIYASRERNHKILTNKHEREKRGIENDYKAIEAAVREELERDPTRQAEALLEGRDPKANRQAHERTQRILAREDRRAKEGPQVEERYQAIRAEVEAERANDHVAKLRQKLDSGKKLSPDDVITATEAGLSDRAMGALEERGLVALTDNEDGVISLLDLQKELGITYEELVDVIETALFSADEKSTIEEATAKRYIDRYGYISSEVNPVARYKLHRENLEGVGAPEETIQALEAKGFIMHEGESENTIPIEILTDMVGTENPLELADALASQKAFEEEVTDRAVDAFASKYGDFPDERGMRSAALTALVQHTDAFTRAIASELNAIAKLLKVPAPAREALTRYAQQKTKSTKISDFRPTVHTRAEHKAGREAQQAWARGNYEEAFQKKHDQFIQHVLAKEADHALVFIEKRIKSIKRALKSKTIAGDFMEQIENLAARFGFADFAVDANAPSLENFILAQQEDGYVFDFPEWIIRGTTSTPYQALTYEQFVELTDAIVSLQSAGRNKQTVLVNGVRVRTADAVREARAQIQESAREMGRESKEHHDSDRKSLVQGIIGFMRNHIKIASWCRIMDGNKDGGIMWTLFSRRANECANKEAEYRKNLTVHMVEILEPVVSRFKMNAVVAHLPGRKGSRAITRAERLSIALNYGNAGNRQRLIDGFETTDSTIRAILEGMTEIEWRCVENIWKTFEMLRPELEALERRIYGRAPEWIQYEPFQVRTAEGKEITVSGGYYPAVYDSEASSLSEAYEDAKSAEVMMRAAVQAVRTDRSHMKARAARVKRPLTLRMSALFDALNTEVHDLAWREFVIDTSRLLKSGLGDTIREYYSPDVVRLFSNWLRDVAVGDKRSRIAGEGWSSRLRQGAGIAGLGFNVVSALAQITGLGISTARLGSAIGAGIGVYLSNPVGATREANEASLFMRNRSLTRFRELNEANNRLQQRNEALDNFRNAAYWLMLRVQQIVDVITWHAAYAKALREGFDDKTAVELADQTVIDTQGGGETKDLSQIERGGEVSKLFTVFYSFMNTALNLNAVAYLGEKNRAKAMAQILVVSAVMPIVESMLRAALPAGGDDDEDDQRTEGEKTVALLRAAAAEVVSFNLGTLMAGRELASTAANIIKGEPVWKWTGPSGARVIGDAVNFADRARRLELDKAMVKSTINLSGSLFGLPSAQINRAVQATDAYLEGEIDTPAEGVRAALLGLKKK